MKSKLLKFAPALLSLAFLGTYAATFQLSAFQAVSLDTLAALEPAPPGVVKSAVVIVGVDLPALNAYKLQDESDAHILDRMIFVKALAKLREFSPAAIGVDFLFSKPRNPETDAKLAQEVKNCGNVVLTGSWDYSSNPDNPMWKAPLPALAQTAKQVASANSPPDDDGIIRSIPLTLRESAIRDASNGAGGKASTSPAVEPFGLAIAKVVLHTEYVSRETDFVRLNNARPFPNHDIPVDRDGAMLLRPMKPAEGGSAFASISIMKLLDPAFRTSRGPYLPPPPPAPSSRFALPESQRLLIRPTRTTGRECQEAEVPFSASSSSQD